MTTSPPPDLRCKFEPTPESKPEPKLRHEFVGMMFAVAIGEVGLQSADLVRAGNWLHHLPAYSHLFLATLVISTSWVGWTLSLAPGARRDVRGIFQWEFLVLLLDVAGVIIYFILVKAVDAPALTVASWILAIFWGYILWDVLTKVIIYWKYRPRVEGKPWYRYYESPWFNDFGLRILPTLLCLILAWLMRPLVQTADITHRLSADFALLSLILLYRALKEAVSAFFPPSTRESPTTAEEKHEIKARKKWTLLATIGCAFFMTLGTMATKYSWPLPLPDRVIAEIKKEPSGTNKYSDHPAPAEQHEQSGAQKR